MKTLFGLLLSLTALAGLLTAESADAGRTVVIDLPHHRVRFTMPRGVYIPPWKWQPGDVFDSLNPSFERNGYRDVCDAYADFNGPFRVGTRGNLTVSFGVDRQSREFQGSILTIDNLDRYVRWWIDVDGSSSRRYVFQFDRVSMAGTTWVHRWYNTFGLSSPADHREQNDIYSFPLDDAMFLDVAFIITECIPGTAKKWKPKAEAIAKSIRESIVVEKKAVP